MSRIRSLVIVLLLAGLVLGVWQPVLAQESSPTPEPQGLRPDAPEYAKHGPYWVGYKPVVIGEGTDHPLEGGLWYPALNPDEAKEEIAYQNKLKGAGDPDTPVPVYGHALADADVDAAGAPYPLVVFSHGFGAGAAWYNKIIEHLASYGFVVLAPEHLEQIDPEYNDLWTASIDRPPDIKQTLDYAEQLTAPDGDLAGLIDMENVAVAGHSYGGYTALAMAGAQYDLDAFNNAALRWRPTIPTCSCARRWCPRKRTWRPEPGSIRCSRAMALVGDPRVKVIIPMAATRICSTRRGWPRLPSR